MRTPLQIRRNAAGIQTFESQWCSHLLPELPITLDAPLIAMIHGKY